MYHSYFFHKGILIGLLPDINNIKLAANTL